MIRAASAEDGPRLQAIELAAGERFRDVGMDAIADHDPTSLSTLAEYAASGRSWAALVAGEVVGYVLVDVVDSCAHVEQISVHPDHQRKGIGQALLAQVDRWATDAALAAVTLTTFTDVPWNRPLYEHLGYRTLPDHEIGPALAALVADEATHGLDPKTRVCMRRDLP